MRNNNLPTLKIFQISHYAVPSYYRQSLMYCHWYYTAETKEKITKDAQSNVLLVQPRQTVLFLYCLVFPLFCTSLVLPLSLNFFLRTPLFPFIFRSLHNAAKRQNTTPLSVTSTLHKANLSSYTQLISSLADHEALIRCPLHCMKLILWINLRLFSICFLKGFVRIITQLGFNCPNYKYNMNKENSVSISSVSTLLGC